MKIIRYYAPIRAMVKKETEETELSSVKDVLDYIHKEYGKEAFIAAKSALILKDSLNRVVFCCFVCFILLTNPFTSSGGVPALRWKTPETARTR